MSDYIVRRRKNRADKVVGELVRCGECEKNDTRNCPFYSGGWIHSDDDFCSYGCRKESE